MAARVSIVIPVHDQLAYTTSCIESLRSSADGAEIVVVDNGSTDGTAHYLESQTGITVVRNAENLGCAFAWNQGVKASRGERIVILNNDVIVTSGWLDGLVAFSEQERIDIASPAIREGMPDYDIETYARNYVSRMGGVARMGVADGICFMVRRAVFETVGAFDENFRIGQFEDADFFRRAAAAGFRLGTTGRSFIHHFGSVTQDALRGRKSGTPYEAENREYFRRKWDLTWSRRFLERRSAKFRNLVWRARERVLRGHTLKERWDGRRMRHG
jgi:GT2 family glycosyltransferase